MKTTMFKNKIFTTTLLGATGAIALCAQQAFAFGMMGGVGVRAGGMGSGRPQSVGSHAGASNVAGAVTMNGITVLPNGTVIVPAVTPRVPAGTSGTELNPLNPQTPSAGPCSTPVCAP